MDMSLALALTKIAGSGGGGGTSNVVIGTFKGTTAGAAMDIDLPYTGSGYPLAVLIYPSEGAYNSSAGTGSFYSLIQRYAAQAYIIIKNKPNSTPAYSGGNSDGTTILHRYKNSTSNSTTYTQTGTSGNSDFNNQKATSNSTAIVKIRSKTKMSVFIASTSYGFAANIEYTYCVIYSE